MPTTARLRRLARLPRRFRLRCAAVLLVAGTVLGAAEAGLRRWDPALNGGDSFAGSAREALTPATRVLIVGTSHVFTGVRPARMSVPAANLAVSGLDYRLAEPLVRAGLRRAAGTRLVLIELNGYSLHADLAERRDGDVAELTAFGVPPDEVGGAPGPAGPAAGPAVFARPAWTPGRVFEVVLKRRVRVAGPGFLGWSTSVDNLKDGARARHHDAVAIGRPARNLPALLATVDRLRSEGVDVVLFRTPHEVRYRARAPARFEPAVAAAVAAVRGRHPGLPFWDDYADPRFTAADFFDEDHLNVRGADRYTAILDRRIRERSGLPPAVR